MSSDEKEQKGNGGGKWGNLFENVRLFINHNIVLRKNSKVKKRLRPENRGKKTDS